MVVADTSVWINAQRRPRSRDATAALAIQHDCVVYTLDGDFDRLPGSRLHWQQLA